jgi:ribosome maturation factor RimP
MHNVPPPPSSRSLLLDRDRIFAIVEPVLRAHGAECVDVEYKNEQGGWVLRVFVEKLGSAERKASTREAAVDLDLCAAVARDLSPALDVADVIRGRYHLEVSTPGLERPLRTLADYVRFSGEKAKIRVKSAVAGQKVLVGVLSTKGSTIAIRDGSRVFETPFENVEGGRLVFELHPSPKPNAHPHKGQGKHHGKKKGK